MKKPHTPRYDPYPSDVSDEEWSFVVPLSGVKPGRQRAPALRIARGIQCGALVGQNGRLLADDAARVCALAGGVSTDAALAARRVFRVPGVNRPGFRGGCLV